MWVFSFIFAMLARLPEENVGQLLISWSIQLVEVLWHTRIEWTEFSNGKKGKCILRTRVNWIALIPYSDHIRRSIICQGYILFFLFLNFPFEWHRLILLILFFPNYFRSIYLPPPLHSESILNIKGILKEFEDFFLTIWTQWGVRTSFTPRNTPDFISK